MESSNWEPMVNDEVRTFNDSFWGKIRGFVKVGEAYYAVVQSDSGAVQAINVNALRKIERTTLNELLNYARSEPELGHN